MNTLTLHWADFLVLGLFLSISLAIGVYHAFAGGKQKTTGEFIMGNRKLMVFPTMISMVVSFISAIMFLGNVAEMYKYGIQAWIFGLFSTCLTYVLVERIFIQWIYPLKLTTIFKYLEMRYQSKLLQVFGAIIGIIGAVLYMGTCMYAPSLALQGVTGLPLTISVPCMAFVATAYTSLGGMKAVIWTDVFQFFVILAGIISVLVAAVVHVGGFSTVFEICQRDGRMDWYNLSPDPTVRHTIWGFMIGGVFTNMCVQGLNQASVQRYSGTQSLQKARITLLTKIPPLLVISTTMGLTGLALYAYYAKERCDPIVSGKIEKHSQILAYFVLEKFQHAPGFAGLFLATLYSGALSSVSSYLSACAANVWEDILKFKLGTKLSEYQATILNKVLVIIFGVISTALAFMVAFVPGPVTQIAGALGGVSKGPMYGTFLLGGIFKRANWIGALVGTVAGIVINWWVLLGSMTVEGASHPSLPPAPIDGCVLENETMTWSYDVTGSYSSMLTSTSPGIDNDTSIAPTDSPIFGLAKFYSISYQWYGLLGALTTIVVGLAVSLIAELFGYEREELPDELFLSWRTIFSCPAEEKDDENEMEELEYMTFRGKTIDQKNTLDGQEEAVVFLPDRRNNNKT